MLAHVCWSGLYEWELSGSKGSLQHDRRYVLVPTLLPVLFMPDRSGFSNALSPPAASNLEQVKRLGVIPYQSQLFSNFHIHKT